MLIDAGEWMARINRKQHPYPDTPIPEPDEGQRNWQALSEGERFDRLTAWRIERDGK